MGRGCQRHRGAEGNDLGGFCISHLAFGTLCLPKCEVFYVVVVVLMSGQVYLFWSVLVLVSLFRVFPFYH